MEHEKSITGFTERFRLKIRLDDCGDKIIPGRFGHLWFDEDQLCAMRLDAPPKNRSKIPRAGFVWTGDISISPTTGKRVQDIELRDIPPEEYRAAIKFVGAKKKKVLSEERKAALVKHLRSFREQGRAQSLALDFTESTSED